MRRYSDRCASDQRSSPLVDGAESAVNRALTSAGVRQVLMAPGVRPFAVSTSPFALGDVDDVPALERDELVELASHCVEPHQQLLVRKLQHVVGGGWGGERVPLTASDARLFQVDGVDLSG